MGHGGHREERIVDCRNSKIVHLLILLSDCHEVLRRRHRVLRRRLIEESQDRVLRHFRRRRRFGLVAEAGISVQVKQVALAFARVRSVVVENVVLAVGSAGRSRGEAAEKVEVRLGVGREA